MLQHVSIKACFEIRCAVAWNRNRLLLRKRTSNRPDPRIGSDFWTRFQDNASFFAHGDIDRRSALEFGSHPDYSAANDSAKSNR